jgi:signal peptidase I
VVERPSEASGWHPSPPHWPGRSRDWMIKRVAALPGDLTAKGDRVPPGKFVVLGDNPAGSYDSRVFGYCPADRLLGVVVFVL